MLNKSWLIGGVCSVLLMTPFYSAAQQQAPNAFGERYTPVLPVVKELTQIVYYRAKNPSARLPPANVYVDGRYHTSLLSGGFTSFCLKPGQHSLGAFVNDPQYRGKTEGRFIADLPGGRTYFLRVDEQQQLSQPPVAVHRQQGESEVKRTHRQIHAHSRATAIVPCVFDRAAAQSDTHYVLSSRILFKQISGRTLLSDEGVEILNELVVNLRQQHPLLHSVVIRLTSRDEAPGVLRDKAHAVRTALTLAAIPDPIISTQFAECDENCPAEDQQVQILAR